MTPQDGERITIGVWRFVATIGDDMVRDVERALDREVQLAFGEVVRVRIGDEGLSRDLGKLFETHQVAKQRIDATA